MPLFTVALAASGQYDSPTVGDAARGVGGRAEGCMKGEQEEEEEGIGPSSAGDRPHDRAGARIDRRTAVQVHRAADRCMARPDDRHAMRTRCSTMPATGTLCAAAQMRHRSDSVRRDGSTTGSQSANIHRAGAFSALAALRSCSIGNRKEPQRNQVDSSMCGNSGDVGPSLDRRCTGRIEHRPTVAGALGLRSQDNGAEIPPQHAVAAIPGHSMGT